MNHTEDFYYIEQTLKGNTKAFAFLLEKYRNYVYTIAFRILKNKEDAEETAQDCFIKAYGQLSNFEGQSKFSTWLYTIVFRLSISKIRKNKLFTTELTENTKETYKDDFSFSQIDNLQKQEQKNLLT